MKDIIFIVFASSVVLFGLSRPEKNQTTFYQNILHYEYSNGTTKINGVEMKNPNNIIIGNETKSVSFQLKNGEATLIKGENKNEKKEKPFLSF